MSDGKAWTGFSRRNVAVDELFLSEILAVGWLGGALNWKNSYSANWYTELAENINIEALLTNLQPLHLPLLLPTSRVPSLVSPEGMR